MVFNRSLTFSDIQLLFGLGNECVNITDCGNNTACRTLVDCVAPGSTGYDYVDGRGCAYDFLPAATSCDDGLYCTNNTVCSALGNCQGGTLYDCNDSVDCTIDACTEGESDLVCVNNPNHGLCTNSSLPYCHITNNCVECIQESDCGTCEQCSNNQCVALTADNGNNCTNRCTECVAGSCDPRALDDNTECRSCSECDGSNVDCQPVNASDGTPWNCNSPDECILGGCCFDIEPDGRCDSNCTMWVNVTGGGDCSYFSPCDLNTAVTNAIAQQSGDIICLRSGYYGEFSYSNQHNLDYITIQADVGHVPEFRNIYLNNVGYWRFNNLEISPELSPQLNDASRFFEDREIIQIM